MSLADEQESTPATPVKRSCGGRRPGAGRKPNGTFSPVQGDLIYAKKLLSGLMRDESQPTLLRARCALAIVTKGISRGTGPRSIEANRPAEMGEDPARDDRPALEEPSVSSLT